MNEVRSINDLFDPDRFDATIRALMGPWRLEGAERIAPQMRIDIAEDDAAYTLKADIPGVTKDDIDIRIDGKQVTVSAQVKRENEQKDGGRVLRAERRYGYASRSFTLDSAVDEAKAEASYRNGVLALRLPKKTGPENGTKLAIST